MYTPKQRKICTAPPQKKTKFWLSPGSARYSIQKLTMKCCLYWVISFLLLMSWLSDLSISLKQCQSSASYLPQRGIKLVFTCHRQVYLLIKARQSNYCANHLAFIILCATTEFAVTVCYSFHRCFNSFCLMAFDFQISNEKTHILTYLLTYLLIVLMALFIAFTYWYF